MRTLALIPLLLAGMWQAKEKPAEGPQVVLIYQERMQIDGKPVDVAAVSKESVVLLGLTPMDPGTAPLPPATMMICRAYTEKLGVRLLDGREVGEVDEIAFRCGDKRYLFEKLDIH